MLHTDRLHLFNLNTSHADGLFQLFTDPQVTEYFPVYTFSQPADLLPVIAMFSSRFKDGNFIRWGISLQGESELIGTIGYNAYTANHRATIVFALLPQFWGQGFASEAIKEVARFGFQELQINRIEAEVIPSNTGSIKTLQRLGFVREGLLRQWLLWNEKYYDIVMYSLLRSQLR